MFCYIGLQGYIFFKDSFNGDLSMENTLGSWHIAKGLLYIS